MNSVELKNVIDGRIKKITDSMATKNGEYTSGKDRLYNFKSVAAMNDEIPETALWGMVSKHIIATRDFIKEVEICGGNCRDYEYWDEKLGDIINYMILLEALVIERINNEDS